MENKDQNDILSTGNEGGVHTPSNSGVIQPPANMGALSLEQVPAETPLVAESKAGRGVRRFLRSTRPLNITLTLLLLVIVAIVTILVARNSTDDEDKGAQNQFSAVKIPLSDILSGQDLRLSQASSVTINGSLQVGDSFSLVPSLQPTGAKPGQIYYDRGTNQLAYYNGSNFVFLTGPQQTPGGVQSLGGATGLLTVGGGLNLTNNQISNSGVLAVQGQAGNVTLTAGPGIVINGTNFSNSGILDITAGTPNVTIAKDDNGGVTISVATPIAGTGTVTSGGGTAGRLPVFTAAQNIEDSIISQAGLAITVGGDLTVTGNLNLSSPLAVGQGGTGANLLTGNGVLVGNGTAAISSIVAGGAGLCLISTAGAPTWGICPGGGGSGVSSLNGLTGGLTIANASAAGSTITIDDATTSTKGIASFNGTNFSVSSGAVDTVQNINSAATPTFAGVNTNSITPSGALTVGAAGQSLTLQGSTATQLVVNNGINSTTVSFQSPTANVTYRFLTSPAGSYDICTTQGNCAGTGGGVTTAGGSVNRLSKFSGAQAIADSSITDDGTNVLTSIDMVIQGGDLTVGVPMAQTGTINLASNGSGFLGSIVQGALSANRTYTLPDASGTICLSSGNCPTTGVTSLNSLVGALNLANATAAGSTITIDNASTSAKGIASFNSTNFAVTAGAVNTIQDINTTASPTFTAVVTNTITPTGTLNVGGSIDVSGTLTAGTADAFQVAANGNITTAGTATISGGMVTLGTGSQVGSLVINDGSSNTGTLNVAALGQNTIYTLPDPGTGSVSICLTSGNCAGTGGGVTTPGGTTNRIAKFSGSQTLGDSTLSDDGTNVTTTGDLIIQGGDVTVGIANSQAGSLHLADSGSAFMGTILQGALTANRTYSLPDADGTICLTSGNCSGSGSSSTLQAAYAAGNTIATTDARDIAFTLANTTTDANFAVDIATGSTGSVAFRRANGAGTADPAQLLLLDNLDTDRAQPTGLRIQSAGGGITTAIDASDPEIVNALSVGDNGISGGVGDITYTNFSMTGATGMITTKGSVVFANTTNSNTTTLNAGVPTANRNLVLPDESGTICVQSSTNCGFALASGSSNYIQNGTSTQTANFNIQSAAAGSIGAIIQGAASQTADILQVKGNSVSTPLLAVSGTGIVNLQATALSTSAFNIKSSLGNNTFTIDTTNSRLGFNLGSNNTPTLNGAGFELRGGLRVRVDDATMMDLFTTPVGANVRTIANFSVFDLPFAGQVIAMGIGAGSDSTARGITIADARSSAHSPSMAVLSPDENQIFGLSWDGLNTTPLLKSSTGSVTLQANSLNVLTALNSSGTARVGIGNGAPSYPLDVTGDINTTTQYRIGGVVICTAAGCAAGSGSTNYIQNGTSVQSANFNVQSAAAGSIAATIQGAASQTADILQVKANGVTNSLLSVASAGAVTLRNSSNSTAAFRVQNATNSATLFSVDTSNNLIRILPVGTINNNSNTSGTGALQIGADSGANIGIDDNDIIARNNGSASTLFVQKTGGGLTSRANFNVFQSTSDSTTAFQVLNNAGTGIGLNVDTTNSRIGIGTNSPISSLDVYKGLTNSSNGQVFNMFSVDSAAAAQGVGGGIGFGGNADSLRAFSAIQGYHESATASDYAGALRVLTRPSGSNDLVEQMRIGSTGQTLFKNSVNSTTAFRIQNANATSTVFSVDTTNAVVTVTALTVSGTLTVNGHIVTGGSTPTTSAGTAACTTPTIGVSGTDTAGLLTVTSGTGCAATGKMTTVNFASAFGAAPRVVLTPAEANAAGKSIYVDNATISTAGFDVNVTTALTNSTTYRWYYHVIQ